MWDKIKEIVSLIFGSRLVVEGTGRTFVKVPMWLAVLACVASIRLAVLTALTIRRKGEKDRIGRWPCFVWLGFLAFIAAGVIYVLYDANAAGNAEKYAAISKYVVFNDAWVF